MKMIIKIARMELQKMFYSPIAWFVLIVFAIQSGITMMGTINRIMVYAGLGNPSSNITSMVYVKLIGTIESYLYLYIPLLTMGLLSREFSSGSIKLLYSSPVSNKQIVLGKFFSMMVFGLAIVFLLFIAMLLGFFAIKDFDLPWVLTGILGLYLVICTYSAIGLFMSSLTSYQVVAAIGTFMTLFVLGQVGNLWQSVDFVRDITYWLSIGGRAGTFVRGLICSEDILYFILVSGLFIAFTIFRLKGIREKSPRYISFTRYAGTFMIVALIGYMSTIPSLMKYHDSTQTKRNTLTKNSQEVISQLKGKITITSYANIFERFFYDEALPIHEKTNMSRYERYYRFYPNMKLKYKYYYDLPVDEYALKSHNRRYEGLTQEEAMKKACDNFGLKSKIFKPGKDYMDEIDLKSELNRYVSKIATEDGKVSCLRVYDDSHRYPYESQITAAFKKLVMELPMVGFVTGHEERDVNDFGSRGYFRLAKEKPFRWSLINNGFDFTVCELSKPVDKDVDILVIAEPKTMFSVQEIKNLNDYIDHGGNLIIAADRKRQDEMNPLVKRFGVKFMEGQVVEHNKGFAMDLITTEFTKEAQKLAYQFEQIARMDRIVSMQGTLAISYENTGEFNYIPVLISDAVKNIAQIDSVGSWNELQTTDFVDDVATYDPKQGETLGGLTTALALTRKVGKKEQRIMILGDADYFSNDGLSSFRRGMKPQENFGMATGMFFWLSNNEVPIDVRRPHSTDNELYIEKSDKPFLNALYKIIIPTLLGLAFLLIWLRRRGR